MHMLFRHSAILYVNFSFCLFTIFKPQICYILGDSAHTNLGNEILSFI
uniref:Uncharacterized protein n=1 Tax=Rhizophora mucronata TaxID=61149 RepID=A0A2P2PZW8_RHIMU